MQIAGEIDLREGLERHLEALAIIEHRPMVIGNAPRTRVQIQALRELHVLREAAELRIRVAAIQRPVAASGSIVVFEYLHFVAGVAQLERGGHACQTGTQDQNRSTLWGALEPDG